MNHYYNIPTKVSKEVPSYAVTALTLKATVEAMFCS